MLGRGIPEENRRESAARRHAGIRAGKGTGTPGPGPRNGKRLPEKSGSVLREGAAVSEKYAFIDAEYATALQQDEAPTVTQMCEWLGVSKSGYYDWRKRPESETEKRREMLRLKIRAIFEYNNEEYGYRRGEARPR